MVFVPLTVTFKLSLGPEKYAQQWSFSVAFQSPWHVPISLLHHGNWIPVWMQPVGPWLGLALLLFTWHSCSQVGFGIGSNTSNEVSLRENEHSQ